MPKNSNRIVLATVVVFAVSLVFTPIALAFLGPLLGGIVSAIVGTAVGVLTLNPAAGMAVAVGICVAVCTPPQSEPTNTTPTDPTTPSTPAAQCSMSVSPSSLPAGGGNVKVSWKTSNANGVGFYYQGGKFTKVAQSGTRTVTITKSTGFSISAWNATSEDKCSKVVTVGSKTTVPDDNGPSCNAFTASPRTLSSGGEVELSWRTSGAQNVSISGIGSVSASGSRTVQVDATTRFTLTATNSDGTCNRAITVSVTNPEPAPTATLSRCNATTDPQRCSPSSSGWGTGNMTIIAGHEVQLRWNSANATSCAGSNFTTGGATDNQSGVTPSTIPTPGNDVTYTLTCNDNDSNTPAATSQVVISANALAPELSASKTTVRVNEPFTLEWNLNGNDPAQCILVGPDSTLATEGSITAQTGNTTIAAVGTATYVLDCPGGDDSIEINVLPQIFES